MKTFISLTAGRRPKERGNTLIMILMVTAILGVTLASYLNLVSNQNISTMRSQNWNAALAVAEAGIEEALAHLYYNLTNRGADGWTLQDGQWTKERTLGTSKYIVQITPDNPPVVTAKGYVKHPQREEFLPPRSVRVTGTNDALWAKGMVAKGLIELNGNGIRTDSFDSTDPTASTGGMYDPTKARDNGDIATNLQVTDGLNVWNADIYGKASTGPGGTVKIGPNGSVGPMEWHAAGKKGIAPGWSNDDMNVQFPDVRAPWTGGAFSVNGTGATVAGISYDFILGTGNYEANGTMNLNNKKMLITGNAVLYVKGDFSVSGNNGGIYIAPGAKLAMYVNGSSTSIAGNGVVNATGNALNFQYYGLPSNTSLSMGGNATFIGSIYAPQAAMVMNGGGSTVTDFVGASITGSVKMNGHYNFHYDEGLGKWGPWRSFVVTQWNEI
ncbi:MAG TPA: hypothetical protein VEH27_04770 [Methylomirabilota bacterium]|nr:hypothetical protein [Methylomirabilota bacterium]